MSPRCRAFHAALASTAALLVAVSSGCGAAGFSPQPGDLLFQDLDAGPLCDAIEKVTSGFRGAQLSHVAVFVASPDGVIEAMPAGVVRTPLHDFLARSSDPGGNPKVIVGRLLPRFTHLVPAALAAAEACLGKPYDDVFAVGNDKYYCSELVYEIFRTANGGRPLFELRPMTFNDPETGAVFPAWADYFRKLDSPVPEGRPGINPGGVSRSPALRIVHVYGKPSGWR
ncbi:MAG: hypothetical protein JW909_09970 [Planctomycetes bacterium]|nr:hypothetical protein [Planctomycetota bacterium]